MKAIAFYPEIAKEVGIEAALLLQQICYWTPKAKRPDGYFYKSWKEFEEETALTRQQQRTAVKKLVEKGWISVKKLRANNAPTLHYRALVDITIRLVTSNQSIGYQQPITLVTSNQSITGEYQENTSLELSPLPPVAKSDEMAEGREDTPVPPAPLMGIDVGKGKSITVVNLGGLELDYTSLMPEVQECLQNPRLAHEFIKIGIGLGLEKKIAIEEFQRFLLRWTEKSPKGRKYRWEMEKTFDVKRRLYTWFNNRATNFGRGAPQKRGMEVQGKRLKV